MKIDVQKMAVEHKDTDYHMVIGSGMLWGEAYDYAMCILEEMQWIKTKSIHAAEYFHGTLELVEEDTSLILFYGEDETRPLMDRVKNFSEKVTKVINIFDTKEVELPFTDAEYRKIVSPMIMYAITERLSCHLEKREIIHLQLEDTIVRWNINKQKISEREAGGTASLL